MCAKFGKFNSGVRNFSYSIFVHLILNTFFFEAEFLYTFLVDFSYTLFKSRANNHNNASKAYISDFPTQWIL